ncbi:TRAP-type C4-dicarboxylate transport system substrate-binding protein [Streptomyces sp. Amel2xB2]|uniref:TRAP transporter substrate-binding protein n=1 Tax=Streptomyces sp. Amel2xB2 TaxID=1305829 RepID=UPI000DBA5E5F|nr:TRAP transporter substrate-binding protein DctP [Streptomyces sp. Amel2xB2]RAJ56532.1 TRAP-type C4-dicarboxylate transport system substrate-binding protein [Streptomyces sp. Amel2xB2]
MNTRAIGRRGFLSAAGLGLGLAAAGASGCAPASAKAGRKPRIATYLPPSYGDLYPGIEMFTEAAAERSGGRLTLDMYDSGALLGAEQLLPGLLSGVADVIFQTSSYVSSTYPVLGAMELPFVTDDYARLRRAIEPGRAQYDLINEKLAPQGVRILGGMPTTFEYLWTVDKPIRRPEDVRGLRLRVAGEIEGETVKALGGAPVTMGSAEVYQALEKHTIDGLVSYVGTVVSRDLQKIVKYGTAGHFGAYTVDAYCRSDWYAGQPPAVRRALDAAGRTLYRKGTAHMVTVHTKDYLPKVEDAGVRLITPDGAELDAFRKALAPVHAHWRRRVGARTADRAVESIRTA